MANVDLSPIVPKVAVRPRMAELLIDCTDIKNMPHSPTPEQYAAAASLTMTAKHMAPTSLAFLNGLLTLTGAAVALLISRVDVLVPLVSAAALKYGIAVLIVSALLGLIARYNTSVVETGIRLGEEGEQVGKQIAEKFGGGTPVEFDLDQFHSEVLRGLFWPTRLLVERGMKKSCQGDYVAQTRVLAKLSQLSGLLILLQFLCVAIGPLIIVLGING